jgi:hypothetical protein
VQYGLKEHPALAIRPAHGHGHGFLASLDMRGEILSNTEFLRIQF